MWQEDSLLRCFTHMAGMLLLTVSRELDQDLTSSPHWSLYGLIRHPDSIWLSFKNEHPKGTRMGIAFL